MALSTENNSEQNKVLVVVHEDVDFAIIAANISLLQSQQHLDICFVDILSFKISGSKLRKFLAC